MTTKLFIARHGNTFTKCDKVCRVGSGTDIPLVESGLQQGTMLGVYLRENNIKLDAVYSSPLKRAKQTTKKALEALGMSNLQIKIDNAFNEIDYGIDEGKLESDVVARLGQDALDLWDKKAIVPDGWHVDPKAIIQDWKNFADSLLKTHKNKTILVVTSNGTARFAPHLTDEFEKFSKDNKIKLSTGAISSMVYEDDKWSIKYWGIKPKSWLEDHNISI